MLSKCYQFIPIKMNRFKFLILIFFYFNGCSNKADPFVWINTLPEPWTLSEAEFESFLPQFQEKFPNYHDRIKALNLWRVGTPYGLFCLGEESGQDTDPIIRNDSSDCTVHVLTTLAFAESFSWQHARDVMVDIHYKMDKEGRKKPTFESRWHFTSDRLLHHPQTQQITQTIAKDSELETIQIELNRKESGDEFLKLDWTSQETIQFLPIEKVKKNHLDKLPTVCGVAFVKRSYFKMGIVIAHEGYFIDQSNLIHASSEFGETVNVDFMNYLYKEDGTPRFDGVMFYSIHPS